MLRRGREADDAEVRRAAADVDHDRELLAIDVCLELESCRDRLELPGGPAAQEGDGDVEVAARDDSFPCRELSGLPFDQPVEHRFRQREGAEEP